MSATLSYVAQDLLSRLYDGPITYHPQSVVGGEIPALVSAGFCCTSQDRQGYLWVMLPCDSAQFAEEEAEEEADIG